MATIQLLLNAVDRASAPLRAIAANAQLAADRIDKLNSNLDAMTGATAAQTAAVSMLSDQLDKLAASSALAAGAQDTAAAKTTAASAANLGWTVGLGGALTILKLVHLGITAFGAQVAADTVGITAFGAATVSAFGPVVENWSTLTTTWGALSGEQQHAVLSIQSLMDTLSASASGNGPFVVFNEAVSILQSLMGGTGTVTAEASQAFEKFAAELNTTLNSPGWKALLSGTGGLVRTDLEALFGLINELISAAPSLVRGFNDIGLAIIHLTSGAVRVVSWLLSLNSGFSDVVAGTGAVLTAWSLLAKVIGPLQGPMTVLGPLFKSAGSAIGDFGLSARIAMLDGGELLPLLVGLAPEVLAVGAAAALVAAPVIALGLAFADNVDPVQNLIAGIQSADQAQQYSIPAWKHGADVLNQHAAAAAKAAAASDNLGGVMSRLNGASGAANAQLRVLVPAQQAQAAGVARLQANYAYLESTYGVTAAQAKSLMAAINLGSGALTGNSAAAQQNRFMIQNLVKTQQDALSPMSQWAFDLQQITRDTGDLSSQVQDLTDAYNALLSPLLAVIGDAASFRQGLDSLATAVQNDGRQVGSATAKQADLAQQLASSANAALTLSEATYKQTGSVQQSVAPLAQEVAQIEKLGLKGPWAAQLTQQLITAQIGLYREAGLSSQQIAGLISRLDSIPPKVAVQLVMSGTGTFSISQQAAIGAANIGKTRNQAAGGYIRGPGGPTSDVIPAMLSNGEYVVKAAAVARYGTHIMDAINAQRFAGGGLVLAGNRAVLSGQYAVNAYSSFTSAAIGAMEARMRGYASGGLVTDDPFLGGRSLGSLPPGTQLDYSPGTSGPLFTINGDLVVNDEADATLIAQRLSGMITMVSLGGGTRL